MNVIGFGGVGCRIAGWFEDYPQYNVYYVEAEDRKRGFRGRKTPRSGPV